MQGDLTITSSRYLAGHRCARCLWLMAHAPVLHDRSVPDREIAELARRHVPGGTAMEADVEATCRAIADGASLLYDAAFACHGVELVVDMIRRDPDGWVAIDLQPATRVRTDHLLDASLQLHTLRACGLDVRRFELMVLNGDCRWPDLSNLFLLLDVTPAIEGRQSEVWRSLSAFREILAGPMPSAVTGSHCHLPRECPYLPRCEAPARDDERADLMLTVGPDLGPTLAGIRYPVAHLGLHAVTLPVPAWPDCRPFDPVPVQVSVHLEHDDGAVEHRDWLADGHEDPREEAIEAVIDYTRQAGSITVYDAPVVVESLQALRRRASFLAPRLDGVIDRIVDLRHMVRAHLDHPELRRGRSIADAARVLTPEIDHRELTVPDDRSTGLWLRRALLDASLTRPERVRARGALLEHGRLDTWAQVRLLGVLRQLAESGPEGPA